MSFYVTGGSLDSNARSYVEREADRQLLRGLLEGEFCYVLTARQMGKSSLMVRTASRLRDQGINVAALDLTAIGGHNVAPEQWYHGLLDMLGQALDLESELEGVWQLNASFGPLHRFMKALQQVLVGHLAAEPSDIRLSAASTETSPAPPSASATEVRLVIFVDEIDFVRSLPFQTDEFFAAIRECYNRRTRDPAYRQLTFCLLGVATPPDLIRDTRMTPFNIGHRIELNDFTPEEAAPLAAGLERAGSDDQASNARRAVESLARILYWTEGHPYLTQKLCRMVAQTLEEADQDPHAQRFRPAALVDQLCNKLFFIHRAQERDDNLIFVRERLLRDPSERAALLKLYLKVWRNQRVMDDELDPLITQLRLSGVVRIRDGRLRERNRIYGQVFDAAWVRANMPQAELRRQRDAYRRAVILTTSVSAAIITALAFLSLLAMKKTVEANLAQARDWRSSGRIGQRVNALKAIAKTRGWGRVFGLRQELQDEAMAALNLLDLTEEPQVEQPDENTNVCELNDSFSRYGLGKSDGRIQIFDRASKRLTGEVAGFGMPVRWMRFDAGDQFLAVGYGSEGTDAQHCVIWNLSQGSRVIEFGEPVLKNAVDFSRDGTRLAVGFKEQHLRVYNLSPFALIFESPEDQLRTEGDPVVCVRFDPEGRQLAESSKGDLYVRVWNIAQKNATPDAQYSHPSDVVDLDWGADGTQLATACQNGDIYLFRELPVEAKERVYRAGTHLVNPAVRFNRQGTILSGACSDRSLHLWRSQSGRELLTTFNVEDPTIPRFSADDRKFSLTPERGRFRVFDVAGGPELLTFRGTRDLGDFHSISFDANGEILLATGPGSALWLWDSRNPQTHFQARMDGQVSGAEFDNRSGNIFAASTSGFYEIPVDLRHGPDGKDLRIDSARALAIRSSFGRFVLATNGIVAAIRRDVNGDQVDVFEVRNPEHTSVCRTEVKLDEIAITPDGRWVFASSEAEQDLFAWDLSNAELPRSERIKQARHMALSPGGKWLVTNWRGECQFREVGSWKRSPVAVPRSSSLNRFSSLAFATLPEDGEYLIAAASSASVIELFKFRDGMLPKLEKLARLESPDNLPVTCLAFEASGGRLAAGSAAQIIEVWDLARISAELQQHDLASGLPRFSATSSSDRIKFVSTISAKKEAEKVTEEILLWIDKLTERINAAEASGNRDIFTELLRRADSYGKVGKCDRGLRDVNRALALRPNDTKAQELKRDLQNRSDQTRPEQRREPSTPQ